MKLTKTAADKATYEGRSWKDKSGDTRFSKCILWDDSIPGFGLRITPAGAKSFIFSYRADGRKRLMTLGRFGPITVDQARDLAKVASAKVVHGGDPLTDRQTRRDGATVNELLDRYFDEHAATKKKAKSIENDRCIADKHLRPRIGHLKVAVVTSKDLMSPLHHKMRKTPYQANRALAVLSKAFNLAGKWGMRPPHSNPTRGIEKYEEKKRVRYMSADELERLAEVLAELEVKEKSPYGVAAVRLLVFTGCRLREILNAEWKHVHLHERRLHLPDSKVGERDVHLTAPAVEVLGGLERVDGCPFVIVGRFSDRPRSDLKSLWRRICERTGFVNLRINDIRHIFATAGVGSGKDLPIVGRLLGHTQWSTTERYGHVAPNPAAEAGERIAEQLAALMAKGKPGEAAPDLAGAVEALGSARTGDDSAALLKVLELRGS